MGRIRIGIDARLRAYRSGGIASHTDCLIEGLSRIAVQEQFVVLTHRRERVLGASLDRQAADQFETRRLATPPHNRFENWAVPAELLAANLDLLHSPDFITPARWRRASVVTVHDLAFYRRPELLTSDSLRYYSQVEDSVARAQRIVVVSEYTRGELLELTDATPERVRVVHNAVHPRFREPGQPDADAGIIAEMGVVEPYVLFVSTIEPRKNIATLLEAHRRLLDQGQHVSLVLAGADGWNSEDVYTLADRLATGDTVRFVGFVPGDRLGALYRRAAILAHPAVDEGFGLTPLEAMASGTPAVVSSAGSLPEVLGDAAMLVPYDDVEAWAEAMGSLLSSPERAAQMSSAGRRHSAQFTLERMAEQTLAVYREALADYGSTDQRS